MKIKDLAVAMFALLMSFSTCTGYAQSTSAFSDVTPEARSNAWTLVVDSLTSTGALFLRQAFDLQSLQDSPSLLLETNAPLMDGLHLLFRPAGYSNQIFFSATYADAVGSGGLRRSHLCS